MSEISKEAPLGADDPIDSDDVFAGKLLGGMLSLFFVYTVITSIYVLWWTSQATSIVQ